jgi:hypothetical protein
MRRGLCWGATPAGANPLPAAGVLGPSCSWNGLVLAPNAAPLAALARCETPSAE